MVNHLSSYGFFQLQLLLNCFQQHASFFCVFFFFHCPYKSFLKISSSRTVFSTPAISAQMEFLLQLPSPLCLAEVVNSSRAGGLVFLCSIKACRHLQPSTVLKRRKLMFSFLLIPHPEETISTKHPTPQATETICRTKFSFSIGCLESLLPNFLKPRKLKDINYRNR